MRSAAGLCATFYFWCRSLRSSRSWPFAIAAAASYAYMAAAWGGYVFVLNLIGMGLGPWFVGILSDILMPTMGAESIRYALCVAVLVNLWAGVHYMLGAKSVRGDLLETDAMNAKLART